MLFSYTFFLIPLTSAKRFNSIKELSYLLRFFAVFLPIFFAVFLAVFLPVFLAAFFGTLEPALRASDSPMAIACFLLVTFLPLPLRSLPRFFSCITFSTFF